MYQKNQNHKNEKRKQINWSIVTAGLFDRMSDIIMQLYTENLYAFARLNNGFEVLITFFRAFEIRYPNLLSKQCLCLYGRTVELLNTKRVEGANFAEMELAQLAYTIVKDLNISETTIAYIFPTIHTTVQPSEKGSASSGYRAEVKETLKKELHKLYRNQNENERRNAILCLYELINDPLKIEAGLRICAFCTNTHTLEPNERKTEQLLSNIAKGFENPEYIPEIAILAADPNEIEYKIRRYRIKYMLEDMLKEFRHDTIKNDYCWRICTWPIRAIHRGVPFYKIRERTRAHDVTGLIEDIKEEMKHKSSKK
ncbi:MAG: hypothetical protein LBF70_02370 [Holosporales bacterium]|jgi:hypothetical protein|nr:hypothetical protein [Holosporales bacterium]